MHRPRIAIHLSCVYTCIYIYIGHRRACHFPFTTRDIRGIARVIRQSTRRVSRNTRANTCYFPRSVGFSPLDGNVQHVQKSAFATIGFKPRIFHLEASVSEYERERGDTRQIREISPSECRYANNAKVFWQRHTSRRTLTDIKGPKKAPSSSLSQLLPFLASFRFAVFSAHVLILLTELSSRYNDNFQ